jgi:transposase
MRAYSQDLRDRVVKAYCEEGMMVSKIAEVFKICTDTIYDWLKRFKTTGDYSSKQGVGCGPQCRFTDKKAILEFIKNTPDADGIAIRDAVAPDLPMSTFYDTLARMEITFKKKNRSIKKEKK